MSFLAPILELLPQQAGILPKWMLFVSLVSIGNSIQCYSTLYFTRRIYNLDPTAQNKSPEKPSSLVTPLSSRTFGTWTLLTALVRLFAAYNLDNPAFYGLAVCTYLVAFMHFMLEWLYYGTAEWGKPLAGPVIVSTSTIIWMALQKGFYLA